MEKPLPKGWEEVELEKVAKWGSGGTPSRAVSSYYGGNIPWIKTGELNGQTITETEEYLTEEGLKNSSAKLFPKGAVAIALYGATIGKTATLGIEATTNQACAVAIPHENIVSNSFLHYYLKSQREKFVQMGQGGAQPNISQALIKEYTIPLPPLPEQHRIVAKLDAVLAKVDSAREHMERLPGILQRFRQSVLAQAVSGKLTKGWRKENEGVESAEELIKQIITLRKKRFSQSSKSSSKEYRNLKVNLRTDLDLFELPPSWSWVDLNFLMDESEAFCYGVVQPGEHVDNGNKLIRVCDIEANRILVDELRNISSEIDQAYKRSRVKKGDLLISVVGTIGRTAIVDETSQGFNIARAVAKIPIRDFNTEFVQLWINTDKALCWLIGDSREVARKTLNLVQLETFPVPLPPLVEQQEIVRRVQSLFAVADRLEARYEALREKVEGLPQALLAKAFRGELVGREA